MTSLIVDPKDFEYDEKDVIIVRGAFERLKRDDSFGWKVGLGTVFLTSYALLKTTHIRKGSRWGLGLLAGAGAYNIYTHSARSYYNNISAYANANASKRLNDMLLK